MLLAAIVVVRCGWAGCGWFVCLGPSMACNRCASCGRWFRPRPQVRKQSFCAAAGWQRAKRASDADYRLNQACAQQAWAARHPDYWRRYRRDHAEYCERNRISQQERDRRRARAGLAKMDVCRPETVIPSGTYRLRPVAGGDLAKMDAWTVQITLLSEPCDRAGPSCKETT
jgi:hypothetical protein